MRRPILRSFFGRDEGGIVAEQRWWEGMQWFGELNDEKLEAFP
jgi:hypothetical protein